ncbi:MAG TPA: hypothetical protein VH643_21495 [Gemmataceae bacterium]
MPKLLLPAALLSFVLAESAFAAPPTPEKSAPVPAVAALDAIIAKLGDTDFRKRDDATRRLEAEGLKALPALKKALGHPDAEVRRRVYDLIPRIEIGAFVSPRRVTLKMSDKPLRAILDEITKQTGQKIEFWTTPNMAQQSHDCDFKDVPLWEAIDWICRDAKLVVQPSYNGDERITLQNQGGYTPHVHHAGAFRFVPVGFQMVRNTNFGLVGNSSSSGHRNETLTLTFQVFSEPRIPMLGVGEVRLTAAYDSNKNTMLAPANNNPLGDAVFFGGGMGGMMMRQQFISGFGNGNRSHMQQSQFQLNRPSEAATKLKVVRGELPITLLVEQKAIVVSDNILKAKGKKTSAGSTTFSFEDVTAQPNKQYQIKLHITESNKDNPNDWTWMNTMLQRIELQDDKGNKFQQYGTSWGGSGPNTVQMTLTYGAPPNGKIGKPSKFVFQQWRTIQHLVRFEFKDLPLP